MERLLAILGARRSLTTLYTTLGYLSLIVLTCESGNQSNGGDA